MAKKVKKQMFKILPVAVVVLIIVAVTITAINLPTKNQPMVADAAAGDGASGNIQLLDTNANGQIDRITFDIANPNVETWSLNGASPYGLSVTQATIDITISSVTITSATNANPVIIQVDLSEADGDLVFDTNAVSTNAMELIYTTAGYGLTPNIQDSVDEELNAIATGDNDATDTENDAAAPVIGDFMYQDSDFDGKIDQIDIGFTETVTAASVLGANDLSFSNVGDFTGAAFGALATDLIVGSVTSVIVPLGTEATAEDTAEDSGSLAIITQNAFSITDGTTANSTTGAQAQATYSDGASPVILSTGGRQYSSSGANGTVDRMLLNFTETVIYNGNALTQFAINNQSLTGYSGGTPASLVGGSGTSSLSFSTSGTTNLTGVSGTTEPTVQYTQDGNAADRVKDVNGIDMPTESGAGSLADLAAPVIINRLTYDNDANGKLDEMYFGLSENHNNSFGGTTVAITGYTSGTPISSGISEFMVVLTEIGGLCTYADQSGCDTGATPNTQITANTTLGDGVNLINTDSGTVVSIDDAEPVNLGSAPSDTLITEADIPGTFTIVSIYSEQMNNAIDPTVTFLSPAPSGTGLGSTSGTGWSTTTSTDDTFTATYTLADTNEETSNIDVSVNGGQSIADANGPSNDPVVMTDSFSIDTNVPTVVAITFGGIGSDNLINQSEVNLGSPGSDLTVAIAWDETMNTGSIGSFTASTSGIDDLLASTALSNQTGIAWSNTQGNPNDTVTITYNVGAAEDVNEDLVATLISLGGAVTDIAGNTFTPVVNQAITQFDIDTDVPTPTDANITVTKTENAGGVAVGNATDVITVVWDAATDSDTDIVSGSASFADFGGGVVALEDDGAGGTCNDTVAGDDIWCATYTITTGTIDDTDNDVTLTLVTDDAGNVAGDVTDGTQFSVDNIAPVFLTSGLTISTDTGVIGVAAVADQVNVNATVTTPDGDTITWDASPIGGGATQANNTPSVVAAGAIDNATYSFLVTVTDNGGNVVSQTTTVIDATTISLDNDVPSVTAARVYVTGANGLAGAFKNGDTPVYTWAYATDGETDTLTSVTFDGSDFAGADSAVVAGVPAVGLYTVTGSAMDSADNPGQILNVTVVDDAGNSVGPITSSATYTIDTIIPVVTPANVYVTGASGNSGEFIIGDTLVYTWDYTTDGETDTISTVTFDGTDFAAADVAVAGVDGGTMFTVNGSALDTQEVVGQALYVDVVDDAGNTSSPAQVTSSASYTIDTIAPSLNPAATDKNYYSQTTPGTVDRVDLYFDENVSYVGAGVGNFSTTTGSYTTFTVTALDVPGTLANTIAFIISADAGMTGVGTAGTEPTISYTAGTDITDTAGNPAASFGPISLEDDANPVVLSSTPANGGTNIGVSTNVVTNFSEEMDPATFTISDNDNSSYTLPTTWTNSNKTSTTIHVDWTAGTAVAVTVFARDLNSVILNSGGTFTFTTYGAPAGGGGGGAVVIPSRPICEVKINSNAVSTDSLDVSLTITATGLTANQMMVSNASDLSGAEWEVLSTTKDWVIDGVEGEYGTKTVYVRLKSATDELSVVCSDSIDFVAPGMADETEDVEPVEPPTPDEADSLDTQDPTPANPLPGEVSVGTLVKRADMSSVYFVDNDNRRHPFPNVITYNSWFSDFSNIQTVSAETLAKIPLGSNVVMRAGTYLIKIQTSPYVYAVEDYGIIRWVKTEAIAKSLFGSDWASMVADVEQTFFMNYQIGSAIEDVTHPNGTIIQYIGDVSKFLIEDGMKRPVSTAVFSANRYQQKFVRVNMQATINYPLGDSMTALPMETLMTLR